MSRIITGQQLKEELGCNKFYMVLNKNYEYTFDTINYDSYDHEIHHHIIKYNNGLNIYDKSKHNIQFGSRDYYYSPLLYPQHGYRFCIKEELAYYISHQCDDIYIYTIRILDSGLIYESEYGHYNACIIFITNMQPITSFFNEMFKVTNIFNLFNIKTILNYFYDSDNNDLIEKGDNNYALNSYLMKHISKKID